VIGGKGESGGDNCQDHPVFEEPWHAEVFALTLSLHQSGHFTWTEWTRHLAGAIAAATSRGEADRGDRYYLHWLDALEAILALKGLVGPGERSVRKADWERAARETPHGKPIELPKA